MSGGLFWKKYIMNRELELKGEGELERCLICGNPVELTTKGCYMHLDIYHHAPLWGEKDDDEL